MTNSFLILTACDHVDQEFYNLGRVALEVPAEVLIERLPKGSPHDCEDSDVCMILDYWPDEASGISDDREVTLQVAEQLVPDLREKWEQARLELKGIYAAMRD